jgi:hypothetical protein
MNRIHRALTTLALGLALVATTAAVAVATPPTGSAPDVNDARKALYQSELAHNLSVRAGAGTQATQATDDVNAARKALYESELARNLATTAPQPTPAAPGRDVGVATIALLSLIVGLIGGAAVVAAIAANRRRHRVVAA